MKRPTRDLPIQFRRVESGVYESVADLSCGALDGEYRIHKTEHSGRGVSHSGRVHWHVRHVPTNQIISHRFSVNYSLSLDDAIKTLHTVIGRWIGDAFEVLAKINAEASRKQAEACAALRARRELECAIGRGIDLASRDEDWRKMDRSLLIGYIADAVQS